MKLNVECDECGGAVEVEYDPGYEPVACSDHDAPAYSDPGDLGELAAPDACPTCQTALDRRHIERQAESAYQDEVGRAQEAEAELRADAWASRFRPRD